jgi:nitrite reductase/ring-hydroxylating ferredoxin subunit
MSDEIKWWAVCSSDDIPDGQRLHTVLDGQLSFDSFFLATLTEYYHIGRYVTVFRIHNKLSVMDSVCHHAGGPLTEGPIQDVEDLGLAIVLCPWHRFSVDVHTGHKVYQGVEIVNGVPQKSGWVLLFIVP